MSATVRVPVIALTGYLGAGKTTLLNHVLRRPGARIGAVINDFGSINVDAGLVRGQVSEPHAITGGCLCHLDDAGGLDAALEKLTHPRLGLDAVIVEASGLAEPMTVARLIRFSGVERVRAGGVIDVVDAVRYFDTIDTHPDHSPPVRAAAATLVVINRCDELDDVQRDRTLERIEERIRLVNQVAPIVRTSRGGLDPTLIYDVGDRDEADELPIAELFSGIDDHDHAAAVASTSSGPISPTRLIDLLEDPPAGVYRLKGTVTILSAGRLRRYVVNVVGNSVHVVHAGGGPADAHGPNELVAIGLALDEDATRGRLENALAERSHTDAAGFRRLQRYRRLSL